MKEKAKAAPKQLIRRGLDDGTERLRGQFREAAQRGQASDYGGDRIEDTAARGAYQARRGVEALLKKKKSAKGREQDGEIRAADPPSPQEPPADLPPPEAPTDHPSPHDPSPQERPQIKTRETVSSGEGCAGAEPSPGERMKRTQIKTRAAAVHDPRSDVSSAPQADGEPLRVRTRETADAVSRASSRQTHAQHTYCTPITWDQAIPGDLVFYPGDTHVGIVGGKDQNGNLLIIHCTYSKNNVVITDKDGFATVGRPQYYSE